LPPSTLAAIRGNETATLVSNRLDPRVSYLAVLKTSSRIACPFCLDIGSAVSGSLGIDEETLADLPRHADRHRFSPTEKAALELAVAMTATPAEVAPEASGPDDPDAVRANPPAVSSDARGAAAV
jgi:alkylhydroperoxidase family enzyme